MEKEKKNASVSLYFLILAVGVILGVIAGTEMSRSLSSGGDSLIARYLFKTKPRVQTADSTVAASEVHLQQSQHATAEQTQDEISSVRRSAIVKATERVEPCVVGIVVTQLQMVGPTFYSEDFFDLFFAPRLGPKVREIQNMGSGFIFDKKGLILTNNHVVEGAKKLYINFADGRQLEGKVVGSDPYSDIAVVSVEGTSFQSVSMGNSENLMIGEWVIAIGNPFLNFFNDAQPTVTVGVISAKNRNFVAPSENLFYQNMIQTDAAINPGNSGGPLVNALGEVIGINAFIYTGNAKNKGSIGIGFAIPINTAKRIAYELLQYGKRRIVWTGITVQDIDRSIALAIGITTTEGVIITDLEENSPGKQAGLATKDVIVRMGNKRIVSHEDLEGFLLNYYPGDTVPVYVMRNASQVKKNLILQEYTPN
ncbi:MAG: trypsin-like peptidase domain-containing protein [Chitinivibrionales bacterium]|nr:trypsin-like peptidase domain-containing protein [Chitinivibrionales bacterium]